MGGQPPHTPGEAPSPESPGLGPKLFKAEKEAKESGMCGGRESREIKSMRKIQLAVVGFEDEPQ